MQSNKYTLTYALNKLNSSNTNHSSLEKIVIKKRLENNNVLIDKEHYTLSYNDLINLPSNFNLNSINFDINITKLSEYINLLHIANNNTIIIDKFKDIDINNLEIDEIIDLKSLTVVKHLEDRNFNFQLIKNIKNNDYIIFPYLIYNNLYKIETENYTFSYALEKLNTLNSSTNDNIFEQFRIMESFNKNNIFIDKEHYILSCDDLDKIPKCFNFNSINFDINITKLSEYIKLLNIANNNSIIYEKFINIDINKLEIDENEIIDLNVVKHLQYKNFNFELINNIESNEYDIIKYLIDNDLYNFFNKNRFDIIKYCHKNTFKFFLSCLNINVNADYDGYTLYKFININLDELSKFELIYTCNKRVIKDEMKKNMINSKHETDKFKILYEDYNLLINDNDILEASKDICIAIIYSYKIEDISKLNQNSLYIILLKSISYLLMAEHITDKYIQILDLVDNLDMNFLITIMKEEYIKRINQTIFKKIMDKINLDLQDISINLKKHLNKCELSEFFHLYMTYCSQDIVYYINYLFSYKDIEEIAKLSDELKVAADAIKPLFDDVNDDEENN